MKIGWAMSIFRVWMFGGFIRLKEEEDVLALCSWRFPEGHSQFCPDSESYRNRKTRYSSVQTSLAGSLPSSAGSAASGRFRAWSADVGDSWPSPSIPGYPPYSSGAVCWVRHCVACVWLFVPGFRSVFWSAAAVCAWLDSALWRSTSFRDLLVLSAELLSAAPVFPFRDLCYPCCGCVHEHLPSRWPICPVWRWLCSLSLMVHWRPDSNYTRCSYRNRSAIDSDDGRNWIPRYWTEAEENPSDWDGPGGSSGGTHKVTNICCSRPSQCLIADPTGQFLHNRFYSQWPHSWHTDHFTTVEILKSA